ncbi:MAG: amino acid racemase [Acidobacteriota bacterium]|nr:amino acid racemase [Acidobacteriota bacterium]
MKTVGIIGGLGPESTVEYYRLIIESYREQKRDGSYPSIIINSIDLTRMRLLIEAGELAAVTDYLAAEVHRLATAGADFGALSANTPHIVFEELLPRSPLPLTSIVETTCEAAKGQGLRRLGLFGTKFTMHAGFYQKRFSRERMTLVLPDAAEQDYIHDRYMGELVNGIFLPETRARLLEIARRLKEEEGIEGLILGGTELPLILRETDADAAGLPLLDTTRIHVKRIVEQLLS